MRPSWESYFLGIARVVSTRSTCRRQQVGAVLVKNRQILATGYNGAPRGIRHCTERGCLREALGIEPGQRHELCRGIHAEQNAIIQAAYHGVEIRGAELYSTHQPCSLCAKMLVNAEIRRLWYAGGYPDPLALEVLEEAGTEVVLLDEGEAGNCEPAHDPLNLPATASPGSEARCE